MTDVFLSEGANQSSVFAKDSFDLNTFVTISQFVENRSAIFAINGDYYGFREDGIEIRNGAVYRYQGRPEGQPWNRPYGIRSDLKGPGLHGYVQFG